MHLKEQFYVALEHTLPYYEKYMKNGGCLIIIPSAQIMKQETWEHLLKLVEEGNNILINGSIEKNEYYFDVDRMKLFDNKLKVKPLASVEKLDLGGEIIPVNFLHAVEYCNSMHALDKCEIQGAIAAKVQKYKYGKVNIYHCSIPIELCSSYYAIDAVYEKIIAETRVKNSIFEVENRKEKDNFFVYTQCFMECIVYTIINEGTTDSICIQDKKSGKKLNLTLEGGRGTKIWLSPNGKILGKYELQKH
jgi:hypothetical protein